MYTNELILLILKVSFLKYIRLTLFYLGLFLFRAFFYLGRLNPKVPLLHGNRSLRYSRPINITFKVQ